MISKVAILFLCSTLLPHAQPKTPRLTFEVASIHPTKPGELNGYIKALPGGQEYISQNIPVKLMISLMYKIPIRQISGAPDWLTSDRYDVDAKADASYSLDDLHLMFQNLLADRFNLKFHKETRIGPVYTLTVDRSSPKLTVNDSPQTYAIPMNYSEDGLVHGKRVPMTYLCWWLGQILQQDERPVLDRTGLDKNYDFTLSFAPVHPPGDTTPDAQDRPSLSEALQQQLGLKLQPAKGPVDFLVIDHIERPSSN